MCVCKKNRVSYIARLSAFLAYVCVYVSRGERERLQRVIQGGGVGKSGGLIHVTPWVTAAVTDKARRRRAAPAGAMASARTDCRQQTASKRQKSDCAAAHSLPMSDLDRPPSALAARSARTQKAQAAGAADTAEPSGGGR